MPCFSVLSGIYRAMCIFVYGSIFMCKNCLDNVIPCHGVVSGQRIQRRKMISMGLPSGQCQKLSPLYSRKGLMSYDILGIGQRIQRLRKEKGLTQEQMSEQLNISTVHLAKIEAGKRGCSLDILIDITIFLGISLDYLVFGKVSDNEVRTRLDFIIRTLEELRRDM